MQNYKENQTDARTFPQIWVSLNPDQQDRLASRIYQKGCCKTRQTIWNWGTGRVQPSVPIVRTTVAQVVSATLGVTVQPHTLFPGR